MTLHDDAAYLALQAHDARFDGLLFIGVTTTGIYCRPVCRVRTPLRQHCRFFAHAARAESAGFRPCLRCRPELAPGLSLVDSPFVLAGHAARMLEQAVHAGSNPELRGIAARLGVTDRHLRRIFRQAFGVSPIDFLTTQRLLLAKRLLTDTELPMLEVAAASGFGSLRRFNAAFAERYRLPPTQLRKLRPDAVPASATELRIRLAYRPPYDIDGVLAFLARRAVAGIEGVVDGCWWRTLRASHQGRELVGWLKVAFVPDRCEVHATLAPAMAPVLGAVVQRIRLALDLDADPSAVEQGLRSLPCAPRPGLRLPGAIDGFEAAVRVILGQQVSVVAARTLTRRLVERYGTPLEAPQGPLTAVFPSAAALLQASPDDLGGLGLVRQRIRALHALAEAVAGGRIDLHPAAPLQATIDALHALPGIGDWTAQLVAMRALGWPDAFPASDLGLLKALGTHDAAEAVARAEAWRPWRSYAVMRLWQTLEEAR